MIKRKLIAISRWPDNADWVYTISFFGVIFHATYIKCLCDTDAKRVFGAKMVQSAKNKLKKDYQNSSPQSL